MPNAESGRVWTRVERGQVRHAVARAQMSKGSKEKCPKGGWAEYRSGPWYKQVQGVDWGERMTDDNAGAYGHGCFKEEPYRFVTIEQKVSGIRQWYDKVSNRWTRWQDARRGREGALKGGACDTLVITRHPRVQQALKDTSVANPFRNRRLLDLMQSLEKKMGRAVAHKPKMLAEDSLKAMLEEVRGTKCTVDRGWIVTTVKWRLRNGRMIAVLTGGPGIVGGSSDARIHGQKHHQRHARERRVHARLGGRGICGGGYDR